MTRHLTCKILILQYIYMYKALHREQIFYEALCASKDLITRPIPVNFFTCFLFFKSERNVSSFSVTTYRQKQQRTYCIYDLLLFLFLIYFYGTYGLTKSRYPRQCLYINYLSFRTFLFFLFSSLEPKFQLF